MSEFQPPDLPETPSPADAPEGKTFANRAQWKMYDWAQHMAAMAESVHAVPTPRKLMGLTEPTRPEQLSFDEEADFREWLKGMDSREITARNAWAARAALAKMRGER